MEWQPNNAITSIFICGRYDQIYAYLGFSTTSGRFCVGRDLTRPDLIRFELTRPVQIIAYYQSVPVFALKNLESTFFWRRQNYLRISNAQILFNL